MKKYFIYIPVVLVVVALPIALVIYNRERAQEQVENIQKELESEEHIENAIYVEAGEGTLTNEGYYSYVGESARGLEAYLGDKGASVMYVVSIPLEGEYTLGVKLSDDGVHPNNTRDATVVINNSKTLMYKHYSEDTKGWKWYDIGTTNLVAGDNTFVFTKNESTGGAYVMDEFRLVPVKE